MNFRYLHSAARLANYSKVQLTLFSKHNCGLCDKAKVVLDQVANDKSEFKDIAINIVDIDLPQNKEWWNRYCMDVPVLHVENAQQPESLSKIFHKLDRLQVEAKIKELR
ncbi:LADA_0E07316g1_1 [Lachancea dasiensis]|uniref:Glutaredoxin-like protein n=1 Tax=Lachancea dasiensis TaxID=1072105 RepID=A0A1G4JDG1_9SACH|nr:LADA_0E07316g1_1 [Lachancea dasiensis]